MTPTDVFNWERLTIRAVLNVKAIYIIEWLAGALPFAEVATPIRSDIDQHMMSKVHYNSPSRLGIASALNFQTTTGINPVEDYDMDLV